jgi:hypothetical protein
MAYGRTREPDGSVTPPESPTLAFRPTCATCGREGAIVFRQIREYDVSVKGAPLVCLECCLETHDRE